WSSSFLTDSFLTSNVLVDAIYLRHLWIVFQCMVLRRELAIGIARIGRLVGIEVCIGEYIEPPGRKRSHRSSKCRCNPSDLTVVHPIVHSDVVAQPVVY